MDARAERTRSAIYRAFWRLLGETSYDTLGLGVVAHSAEVSRSTVYHHFADKNDLLWWAVDPLVKALAMVTSDKQSTTELSALLSHCLERRCALVSILVSTARDQIRMALTNAILRLHGVCERQVELQLAASSIAEAELEFLDQWLSGMHHLPAHHASRLLHQLAFGASAVIRDTAAERRLPDSIKRMSIATVTSNSASPNCRWA